MAREQPSVNSLDPTTWEKPFGVGLLLGLLPLATLFALGLINQVMGVLPIQVTEAAGLLTLIVFVGALAGSVVCIVRRSTRYLGLGIGTGTLMAFGLGETFAFVVAAGGGQFLIG